MPPTPRFRVESLHVYPVKACAGIRVPELAFGGDGAVEHDREWVIVDDRGEVTWQGAHPRLALVRPALAAGGVVLTAPGGRSAALVPGGVRPLRAWNDAAKRLDELVGEDAGDEAAALLAEVTGAPLRAVRLARAARLRDGANPVHLACTRSLDALDHALAGAGLTPVPMARFRPNVALAPAGADGGSGEAWIEERLARLVRANGGPRVELTVVGPCVRCVVPNVDLETAALAAEPLATVARLGRARRADRRPVFGIYARPTGGGAIAVGEELEGEVAREG